MNKIIECVPNFSEGRDIAENRSNQYPLFRGKQGVKTFLDYSNDEDHNRL